MTWRSLSTVFAITITKQSFYIYSEYEWNINNNNNVLGNEAPSGEYKNK